MNCDLLIVSSPHMQAKKPNPECGSGGARSVRGKQSDGYLFSTTDSMKLPFGCGASVLSVYLSCKSSTAWAIASKTAALLEVFHPILQMVSYKAVPTAFCNICCSFKPPHKPTHVMGQSRCRGFIELSTSLHHFRAFCGAMDVHGHLRSN